MTTLRTSADMSNLVQCVRPRAGLVTSVESARGASTSDIGRRRTSADISTDVGRVRRQPDVWTDRTPPLRGCPPSNVRPDHSASSGQEGG